MFPAASEEHYPTLERAAAREHKHIEVRGGVFFFFFSFQTDCCCYSVLEDERANGAGEIQEKDAGKGGDLKAPDSYKCSSGNEGNVVDRRTHPRFHNPNPTPQPPRVPE